MDKTIIGLLGGASALALLGSPVSAASPPEETSMLQPARSFAELLDPIPNAESVLRAENERGDAAVAEEDPLVVAQYHHHHHHYHHHHHHYYHHHYHHHHHYY